MATKTQRTRRNEVTITAIREIGSRVADATHQVIDPEAYRVHPVERKFAQQGDIYLRKLNEVPQGAVRVQPFLQLAPGVTIGSHHCLDDLRGVQMYTVASPGPLDGPVVETSRAVTVT